MKTNSIHYCRDASDELDCNILDYGVGYNKLIIPVDEITGKVKVNMEVDVENLLDINEVLGTFSVKYTLRKSFFDHRLTYRNLKDDNDKNQLTKEEQKSIWVPYEFLSNTAKQTDFEEFTYRRVHTIIRNQSKPPRKSDITSSQTIDLFEGTDHKQLVETEFYVVFLCDYEMSRYPFDTQVCTMEFRSKNYNNIELVPGNLTYSGPTSLAQYFVHSYWICSSKLSNGHPGIKVILTLGRPLIGTILTVYIPTFILIVLAHMSNVFADNYLDMVINVNLTALLVLASL